MLKFKVQTKTKITEPLFYTIVLDRQGDFQYLWSGIAYCLEEAINKARKTMVNSKSFTPVQIVECLPSMYNSFKLSDIEKMVLKSGYVEFKQQDKSKNQLMQKIVRSNDKELLKDNANKLNISDKKYLKEKLC